MGTLQIENPERYDTLNVDTNGKIHLGKDYAGKKARVVIEAIEDAE